MWRGALGEWPVTVVETFSANLEALRSGLSERSTTLLTPRTLCRIFWKTIDHADGLRALPARNLACSIADHR
jgi:hypothetical protein